MAEAAHPVEPVDDRRPRAGPTAVGRGQRRRADKRARRDARREATFRRWLSFSR